MKSAQRQELKQKIEAALEEVKQSIVELTELTKPIPPENSLGRITRMDAINNKSVNEATLRQTKMKLNKLNHALNKIDDPKFGTCSRCRKPIQMKRLMFMPESNFCIRCAR